MTKIIISIVAVIGAVGFLFLSSSSSASHYKMVNQLMDDPAPFVGKTLRVHGHVTEGSIKEEVRGQDWTRTFELHAGGKTIAISHVGPAPDTFRDGSEVVALGKLTQRGDKFVLDAVELSAKCPSKYEGAATNKQKSPLMQWSTPATLPTAAAAAAPATTPGAAATPPAPSY